MSALPWVQRYTQAMCRGDLDACIRIEQRFDLYGYPPQIVGVGLQAVDEGRDHLAVVDSYLAEQQS